MLSDGDCKRPFQFEKTKTYRQYFRAATLSVDEAGYILHYKHSINQKFHVHPGYRTMGNVYVYQRTSDIFLGHRNNSITASALSQE